MNWGTTAFLTVVLLIFYSNILHAKCEILTPYLQSYQNSPNSAAPLSDWILYYKKIEQTRDGSLGEAFKAYIQNQLQIKEFLKCVPSSDLLNFRNTMYSIFLRQSLEHLRHSKSTKVRKFISAVIQRINEHGTLPFRLLDSHADNTIDPQLKGGFHRSRHSIYLNLDTLQSNEWFIILIHELVHAMDSILEKSVSLFANSKEASEIFYRRQKISELIPNELTIVRQWTMAGLDRGFLGELRAWRVTYALYLDGLQNKDFEHVDYLDTPLTQKRTEESIPQFLFRYLDTRFYAPTEFPFDRPLGAELYNNMRSTLRTNPLSIDMGRLEQFE